jgi:hypothetical protein
MKTSIINWYAPYASKQAYWDPFFSLECTKEDYVIIGGDLNFIPSWAEIWGASARLDSQVDFFFGGIK